jgi:glycosyltransferase involved in cell wall biosynthesis
VEPYTILHTIDSEGPGGAETVLLNLATRLDTAVFRSIVLVPPNSWLSSRLKEQGVLVIEVSWKVWWDLRGPWKMIEVVRKHKVDLIHSHLPAQNFYSCLVGAITRTKTLAMYHGPVELEWSQNIKGRLRLWFVRIAADGVVVVCDLVKRLLVRLGFEKDCIALVYNGIDASPYAAHAQPSLRRELGLPPEQKLVGMIANVRPSKGYDVFVRACAEVCKKHSDVTFLGVGDVNEEVAAPIKLMCEQFSLGNHFRFLGFRSDVSRILKELNVFVLASTSEGMPLAILEAMAAGTPVISTSCGGIPEVIDHERTGLLVPPSDHSALSKAISRLLADPEYSGKLVAQAQDKFYKEFTLDGMIERYDKLYRSYLGQR